jgi:hypothetical protein
MPSFSLPPVSFARIPSPVANPNQKNTVNRPFFQTPPHTGKDQVHFGLKTGLSKIKVTDSPKYIIKMLKAAKILSDSVPNSVMGQKLLLKAIKKGETGKLEKLVSLTEPMALSQESVGEWMKKEVLSDRDAFVKALMDNNNEQQCKSILCMLGLTTNRKSYVVSMVRVLAGLNRDTAQLDLERSLI